jgi:hypothetical protein
MHGNTKKDKLDLVIFGDSLCTDFYVTRTLPTMIRARMSANSGGWPSRMKLNSQVLSTVSGHLTPAPPSVRLRSKLLLGAKNIDEKINSYIKTFQAHPKAYFIFLGHNNLDWYADTKKKNISFDEHLRTYPKLMSESLISNLKEISTRTASPNKETPIVISGLANYHDFFPLRENCLKKKEYKFAHMSEIIFESIKQENQENLLKLQDELNIEVQKIISKEYNFFKELNYNLSFSDVFSKLPLKDTRILNDQDAWHLSDWGKDYFANAIEEYLTNLVK